MGKRYYCDYCERSFKDDPESRKKHLSSFQHAKNRADHYSFYKDPETILQEEQGKIPCKRYMSSGDCAFGRSCKFSHYAPPLIWELQRIVAAKQMATCQFIPEGGWPDPDDIVKEFFVDITNPETTKEITYPIWEVPPELHNYPNLPPSLWPLKPESITDSNFGQWL
ncbi:PREDICTED: zinc finger matrin-type protein 5 [Polistes canadensis]|uniref:zinc finger matrin-type protein 5 n=1 Tax=Polistes canadensis TaxID=91411 RepID=UPI000718C015|nr:PREDICTED: zinc finger matrin-type protein 5 [Polistes canadensis]KAI4480373.1 hypothetical protein M0804_010371 [Polistes exclamans]